MNNDKKEAALEEALENALKKNLTEKEKGEVVANLAAGYLKALTHINNLHIDVLQDIKKNLIALNKEEKRASKK